MENGQVGRNRGFRPGPLQPPVPRGALRRPLAAEARVLLMARRVVGRGGCQRIAALVLGMAGVALDPDELHVMRLLGLEHALPQIGVLHRLLLRVLPPALEPAVHPVLVERVHRGTGV